MAGKKKMGHISVIAAAASGLLVLSLAATPAGACGCQKEYMIKKYGSISGLDSGASPPAAPTTPSAPPPATGTPPAGPTG
jgi:hypothetical protein